MCATAWSVRHEHGRCAHAPRRPPRRPTLARTAYVRACDRRWRGAGGVSSAGGADRRGRVRMHGGTTTRVCAARGARPAARARTAPRPQPMRSRSLLADPRCDTWRTALAHAAHAWAASGPAPPFPGPAARGVPPARCRGHRTAARMGWTGPAARTIDAPVFARGSARLTFVGLRRNPGGPSRGGRHAICARSLRQKEKETECLHRHQPRALL